MEPVIEKAFIAAERIARAILPDLNQTPLYLVMPEIGSMVPPSKMGEGVRGFYLRNLDRMIQPQLEAEGRWQGPGVAVVIDAFWVTALAFDDDDALRRVVGILLHELAHWADRPPSDRVPDHNAWLEAPEVDNGVVAAGATFSIDFLFHSEDFCRAAAHLWYRARTSRTAGMVLQPKHMRFGSDYRGLEYLPHPMELVEALSSELELRRAERLRDILATRSPPSYTSLWHRCYASMPLSAELVAQLQEQ